MKWKNIDIGAAYYYITGTFTEWLPLLDDDAVRTLVIESIKSSIEECEGWVSAYVLMPDHLHLLVFLPREGLLHRFNRLWRGRSARLILNHLTKSHNDAVLQIMALHSNGPSQFAVWKEQVRALAIWDTRKLNAIINYIHSNPARRNPTQNPENWKYSSWGFYESGESTELPVRLPEF